MHESSVTIDPVIDEAISSHESDTAAELFSKNIEALRNRQPNVATTVELASLPAGASRVASRDGCMTYQLTSPTGRTSWLGQSSMPCVSATALLFDFVSDGSNVVLPGMATGRELLVLAERMPACAAVFVAEQDAAVIRMVFELYDYTELLSSGRVVIFAGDQFVENLVALFSDQPGYTWPNHMLPMIHHDHAWCTKVQTQLDQARGYIAKRQDEIASRLIESIRNRRVEWSGDIRRVALLSTSAAKDSVANANVVCQTLEKMRWPTSLSAPAHPDSCHLNDRLKAIEQCKANLVLFVDCLPGSMIAQLPFSLHTVSWFWPGDALEASVHGVSQLRDEHLILASTSQQRDQLITLGVSSDRITILPPGADFAGEAAEPVASAQETSRELAITVLADLPDDRPEVVNVTLSSQVRLWQALQQVVATSVDQYTDERLDDFLQEAQRQSGMTISDDAGRSQFRQWLKWIIGPASYARAIADWLATQGSPVSVDDANWCNHERWIDNCQAPTSSGSHSSNRIDDAPVVVMPEINANMMTRLLGALASGKTVIARSTSKNFDTLYPGLGGIAELVHWFRTTRDLSKILKKIAANPDELAISRRDQVAFVRDNHSMEKRLRTIDCLTR